MTTTDTFTFNPAASSLVLAAYRRIGIHFSQLNAQHMEDAETECDLLQVKLANKQPNLWTSQLQTLVLTPEIATYTMPGNLIAIQAVYISTTSGGTTLDRLLRPYSTVEYAALPNKTQQGQPTIYWYDRQIVPVISLYPVPDDAATYTIKVRVLSQIEDVSLPNGMTLDMPYRWLDVFVAELAHRLSRIYAPDREQIRKADADEAWAIAAKEDQEDVPMYIKPALGGYFR